MKKWAYPILIAFVAFFIFSNPARAGTQGRQFVIWVGDLAGAAGEFLDGLFDDDPVGGTDPSSDSGPLNPNADPGSSNPQGAPAPSQNPVEPAPSGGNSFETLAPIGPAAPPS